jgi:hypothetical protein
MDIYVYDPSVYYGDETDSVFNITAEIQFEFGAPASTSARRRSGEAASSAASNNKAAMHSSAQTRIQAGFPLHESNTGGTLWIGLGLTTFVVTVRMRRNGRFIGRRRFLMSHPALVYSRCSCWRSWAWRSGDEGGPLARAPGPIKMTRKREWLLFTTLTTGRRRP